MIYVISIGLVVVDHSNQPLSCSNRHSLIHHHVFSSLLMKPTYYLGHQSRGNVLDIVTHLVFKQISYVLKNDPVALIS